MQRLTSTALFVAIAAFLPSAADAAVTLNTTIAQISNLINGLIPLVLAIAVLVFFWGLAMYMFNAGDTEKRKEGISIMFMGIIVIFVMVSVWGIVRILQATFQIDSGAAIIPATIQRGTIQ